MPRQPWDITPEMYLSQEEASRLLRFVRAAARGGEPQPVLDRLIVETLLFSGLRTSEFCRLRVLDTGVALKRPVLRVRGVRGGERIVWIPAAIDRLVREYVRDTRPRLLASQADPQDGSLPLAISEHRGAFERTGLYRRVVRILAGAGFGDRASVQLLRHTYGYLAYLRTGGNLLFVQRQLGHAHPMITSVYAELVPESYENLANVVGRPRQTSAGRALPNPT